MYPKNRKKREKFQADVLTKHCIVCNTEFQTKLKDRIACSRSCGAKYNHARRSETDKKLMNDKREATCLEKYGDKHVVNSEYTREKTFAKHGNRYAMFLPVGRENWKQSLLQKYGVDNPLKVSEIRDKMIATKIKVYGDLLKPLSAYKIFTF